MKKFLKKTLNNFLSHKNQWTVQLSTVHFLIYRGNSVVGVIRVSVIEAVGIFILSSCVGIFVVKTAVLLIV